MAYAETTSVAFERSVSEIVTLIKRHGAQQIGQMDDPAWFAIQFKLDDRMIRFHLPFKTIADMPTRDGRGSILSDKQRADKLEQSKRQRGRALMLVIKAKLESVASGIETIEQAFLANVVMANGQTVYDRVAQPLALEYETGAPDVTMGLLPPPGVNA